MSLKFFKKQEEAQPVFSKEITASVNRRATKFEHGMGYWLFPANMVGRERYENRVMAVAAENEEGSVDLLVVTGILIPEITELQGCELARVTTDKGVYTASAGIVAPIGEAIKVLNAIKKNRETFAK